MGRDFDPHNYRKRLDSALRRLKNSDIDEKDKRTILDFHDDCFSRGISTGRVVKYVNNLLRLSRMMGKTFEGARKSDISGLVREIETSGYTEHTRRDFRIAIKRFYKWLRGDNKYYPEEVEWIKTTMGKDERILPEELLTEKEVERMIGAADHPRDKAFVSLLYESGTRIGEVLGLKRKHVSFDRYGAQIVINGKTGMRRVRLVSSSAYLATWVENHPLKDQESFLWVGIGTRNKNRLLSYHNVQKLLRRIAGRAGVKKRVYPHLFRHSRATHLSRHLTEAQMNQIFGWVQGSDMPSTYIHMSGRDTDDALLKLHGLKRESDEDREKFKSISCPRCETINPPGAKLCNRCGLAQDMEAAMEIDDKRKRQDDVMSRLLEDGEVKSLLVRKIREHGLGRQLKS